MTDQLTISLDAMGGDNGPDPVIGGADILLGRKPNLKFQIHGEEAVVMPVLERFPKVKAVSTFHDCETSPFPSNVHAHYNDLKSLPKNIKEKMWLCHYNDGDKPDCIKDGFAGWVQQGQVFDFV
mgnify:CR=1 FL=1